MRTPFINCAHALTQKFYPFWSSPGFSLLRTAFEELVVPFSTLIMPSADEIEASASGDAASGGSTEGERPKNLKEAVGLIRSNLDSVLDTYATSALAPTVVRKEVLPLFKQVCGGVSNPQRVFGIVVG